MADTSTQDARPDLFAGASARDDSYRILARLAHGGALPEPPLRFDMNSLPNARTAAAVALIALAGAALILMRDGGHPPEAASPATARGAASGTAAAMPAAAGVPALPPSAGAPQETQAAAIINDPAPAVAPPAAQPAPLRKATPGTARAPAVAASRKPAKPTAENDEDVTLLAAMLKHAGKQKTPPTRPAEE